MRFLEIFVYIFFSYFFFFHLLADRYKFIAYNDLVWAKNIQGQNTGSDHLSESSLPEFQLRSYHFKNDVLFYNKTGEMVHRVKLDSQTIATVSKKNYITYQKAGDHVTLFNQYGHALWRLDTFSYPILSSSGNRVLFMSTDCTSIKIYDDERNEIFPQQFLSSMILDTAFCPFNDNLAVGTSEGNFLLIDHQGQKLRNVHIGGSRHTYIKSVAVSKEGKYYACIAGLYPEYLVLFDQEGKELWRRVTGQARRRKTSIYIDSQGKQILEQTETSVLIRSLKNRKNSLRIAYGYSRHQKN